MKAGIILFIIGAAVMVVGLFVNIYGYWLHSWAFFLVGLSLLMLSRFMLKPPGKICGETCELYRRR